MPGPALQIPHQQAKKIVLLAAHHVRSLIHIFWTKKKLSKKHCFSAEEDATEELSHRWGLGAFQGGFQLLDTFFSLILNVSSNNSLRFNPGSQQ